MQCNSCKSPTIVEDLGNGKKKVSCSQCGLNEIIDNAGRKLLNEVPTTPARTLLE